jgi:hypothetical protein
MTRPLIGIDDEVRQMTEEEYADLLATGWTLETPLSTTPLVNDAD